jgi:hypothetical protein
LLRLLFATRRLSSNANCDYIREQAWELVTR